MIRFLFLLLMITAFYWSACSCNTEANGVVLDSKTFQPLQGVTIQLSALNNERRDTLDQLVITNAEGFFEARHTYCEKYSLDFSKEGYNTQTRRPQTEDTIYLSRVEALFN